MRIEPQLGSASIVLLGSFNPAIITPDWLVRYGLVPEAAGQAAREVLITEEITQFEVDNILVFANKNQFSVETTQGPWVRILDFVAKAFGEILTHTPLHSFGINRSVHFGVGTEAIRNEIGRRLAPLEPWGEWGKAMAKSKPALRAGAETVSMKQPWKEGEFQGKLSATVQPSVRISGNSGIFIRVNDHCELSEQEAILGSGQIVHFLLDRFEDSIQNSEKIIDQIMSLKEAVEG